MFSSKKKEKKGNIFHIKGAPKACNNATERIRGCCVQITILSFHGRLALRSCRRASVL